ncbi:hypothetical protein GWK47_028483 [Chionoecetes opilio]|uniref:Uncharacterized protein n=1 Tax=Chionoecetes opilio TaxID=41210 RepID=A0A8J4YT51_CHIOP|nr:hypothetical protein GWK47_028483 [Chionoecetes opilio]
MPKLPAGTGAAMATKVVEVLGEWGIKEKVVGMSFDTTASNTGIHTGCCRLLEEALGKPLPTLPAAPPRHRANPGRCVQGGDGAILWTNDFSCSSDSGNSGPTSLMKISKPSTTSSTRGSISFPSWKEASIGAMGEGSSRRKSERTPPSCATCPSSISPEKTPVSRSRSRGPSTTPVGWQRQNYVLKIRMFRSHVQMTTREGKGLEEIALPLCSPLLARVDGGGLATEAAYKRPQPREGPAPLPGDQRSDREDDPHHILPPSLGNPGADLVGLSLFSEGDQHGGKKKIAEETRKEKDLDRIRFNKAADQLINSSLPSLTSSACFARSPSSTSTFSPFLFPPLGRVGSKPCVPEGGVHSEEPQRQKRRGRRWGGDDFIVQRLPKPRMRKTKQDLLQVVENSTRRNYPHPH